MTSARASTNNEIARDGGRIASFYGVLLSNLGSLGIFLFWSMGATHLLTNNGGQINDLNLTGLSLVLFWAYPVMVLVGLSAWLFYRAGLDLVALAVAGSPIALVILYYLWLVMVRGV